MAVYELTLRFELPDDHAAMSLGIHIEEELKAIARQSRWLSLTNIPAISIQRLTRIIAMKIPAIDGETR